MPKRGARTMTELDRLDRRILRTLLDEPESTSQALSEQVHLSPTAVQRRVRRLKAAKVIEGHSVIVSPKAVGRPISMFVNVILEREKADVIDRFKQAIRSRPEIMMGHHVTGETDFVLLVTARTMEDFEEFTRSFLYAFPEVKTFKTNVVMDRVKTGFGVPIED